MCSPSWSPRPTSKAGTLRCWWRSIRGLNRSPMRRLRWPIGAVPCGNSDNVLSGQRILTWGCRPGPPVRPHRAQVFQTQRIGACLHRTESTLAVPSWSPGRAICRSTPAARALGRRKRHRPRVLAVGNGRRHGDARVRMAARSAERRTGQPGSSIACGLAARSTGEVHAVCARRAC